MMLDYPYYEEESNKREVAKCCECGASIYNTEDYYLVGDEYICESCRDVFMDNHIVFAEEG